MEQRVSKGDWTRKAVLFTDLQDSTKWLYKEGPDIVFRALEHHMTLLKNSFATYSGEVVKRTGDGVMAIFDTLENATRAAINAQQVLARERIDKARPINLPPMRIGISAGEVYKINLGDRDDDYFGKVCAEANRLLDLADGHHIILSNSSLDQEHFGKDALVKDGINFSSPISVYRKGLNRVSVCEVIYKPYADLESSKVSHRFTTEIDLNGYIVPQKISRSRADLSPFSFYLDADSAQKEVEEILLSSNELEFLHIRGIVAGSSSPFNSFVKLMSSNEYKKGVQNVRVAILDPDSDWLMQYYMQERNFSKELAETRIRECKEAIDIAQIKLERFCIENKINSWQIFLYKTNPMWRLLISPSSIVITPYGGKESTTKNTVLISESNESSIYLSFRRFYKQLISNSILYASSNSD